MKSSLIVGGIALFIIVLAVLFAGVFVSVPEDRSVLIKRFNKIVKVYNEPGLATKTPFIDSTVMVYKKAQVYNMNATEVLTLDKKNMTVSSYVVWKIVDPMLFYQNLFSHGEAEGRLDVVVYNAVKNLISSMNQQDAISSRGKDMDETVLNSVISQMSEYGIEVIDVQIKQFDLPQDNKDAVFTRMISERNKIAALYRAEGQEAAEKRKNSADKEVSFVISEAKSQAEQLKAEGEQEYMKILADAYRGEERADFYEFIRSMDALKLTMKGDKTLFLPMDSQLTKWFKGIEAK